MKTYKELMERAFSPAGQAARAKMRQQGDFNAARKAYDKSKAANPDPKALPPGKQGGSLSPTKGGALAHRPADTGRNLVKQKSSALATSKPGALATTPKPKSGALTTTNKPGDNSNKMGRVPNPYRYGQPPDGPQSRPQKPQKNKKKKGPGPVRKGFNFLKKGLNNTVTDGQPESSGGGIDAPKRGVYNG